MSMPAKAEKEREANRSAFTSERPSPYLPEVQFRDPRVNFDYFQAVSPEMVATANVTQSVLLYYFVPPVKTPLANFLAKQAKAENLEQEFQKLAQRWKRETGHFSVIARRYQHPAYNSILEMKGRAVPLILRELRRNPDRWFAALEKLSNENPAKGAANFYEAVDRWIAWGIDKEFIE